LLLEVYPETSAATRSRWSRPERRGVSRQTVIQAAKEAVSTLDLAKRLCTSGRMQGEEWVARCPLPGHEDRVPSFTVNPVKNLFFCHGCVRGGDVITLAQLAWNIDRADVAAAEVLLLFGHEIPPRPASWYRKGERQKPARDALQEARIRHLTRRIFRIFLPMAEGIEDEAERRAEREYLWDAAEEIAVLVWAGRRGA
jgi:hypothetical protein